MKVLSILKNVRAILAAIFVFVCGLLSPLPQSTSQAELISQRQYVLDEAFAAGQGLAADGEYLYTSGAMSAFYMTALSKIDIKSGKVIQKNLSALPFEFTKKGYDHIGAISLCKDTIYAPVEHRSNADPLVLLFDKNTLEYTGVYYQIDQTYLHDGIPWCAVDEEAGLLYTSPFHHAQYILAFNLKDMSFEKKIDLSCELDRIQGAVCSNGKLFANLDPNEPKGTKAVKAVNLETGEVSDFFSRNVTGAFGCETEGITLTFTPEGKMRFIIADYDKTVCVFIRTYEPIM